MTEIEASVVGARSLARELEQMARGIEPELRETQKALGEDAELIFAAHAPKGPSGRLSRGIVSSVEGDGVIVTAEARNPLSGYDYVRVTRFGHRVTRIVPRRDRSAASVVATKGKRGTGRRAALRFSIGGRVMYRQSVKGYKPSGDWAEKAMPQVQSAARVAEARLTRKIEALL